MKSSIVNWLMIQLLAAVEVLLYIQTKNVSEWGEFEGFYVFLGYTAISVVNYFANVGRNFDTDLPLVQSNGGGRGFGLLIFMIAAYFAPPAIYVSFQVVRSLIFGA